MVVQADGTRGRPDAQGGPRAGSRPMLGRHRAPKRVAPPPENQRVPPTSTSQPGWSRCSATTECFVRDVACRVVCGMGSWCVALTGAVEVPPRDREVLESWTAARRRCGRATSQRARIVLMAADGVGTNGDRAAGRGLQADGDLRGSALRARRVWGAGGPAEAGTAREIDEAEIVARTLEAAARASRGDALVEPTARRSSSGSATSPWPRCGGGGACSPGARRPSSSPPTPSSRPSCVMWSGSTCTRRTRRWCCVWTRSPRSRPWTGPRRSCRCALGCPEKATHDYVRHGTTTCSPRSRSPPARWSTPASTGTDTRSSCASSAGGEGLPEGQAAPGGGQLRHPQAPRGEGVAGPQPAGHAALHPDLGVVAQPGRGLLLDHHPPGHPPRQLPPASTTSPTRSAPTSTAGTTRCQPFAWTKTRRRLLPARHRRSTNFNHGH